MLFMYLYRAKHLVDLKIFAYLIRLVRSYVTIKVSIDEVVPLIFHHKPISNYLFSLENGLYTRLFATYICGEYFTSLAL
jgi:hypothetical protein